MRLMRNRPTLPSKEEPKKEEKELENEIYKQKNFQQNMYIDFIKKFINEKCEYDYQYLTHIDDIKKIYSLFMQENRDFLNQYNVSYGLTPSDIPKLDKRFEFKLITICKYCRNKQFRGCCDKYVKVDNTKLSYIVNLKLII